MTACQILSAFLFSLFMVFQAANGQDSTDNSAKTEPPEEIKLEPWQIAGFKRVLSWEKLVEARHRFPLKGMTDEELRKMQSEGVKSLARLVAQDFYNENKAVDEKSFRELLPELIKLLQVPSTDEDTRAKVTNAIGAMGSEAKGAVPDLIKLLAPDTDEETRRGAVRALGAIGSEAKAAVPDMIKLLAPDTDEATRYTAVRALGGIGAEAKVAVPGLIKLLAPDTNYESRERAAIALGKIGAEAKEAVPDLIKQVTNAYSYDRQVSLEALGAIGSEAKEVVPDLIKLLAPYIDKDTRQSSLAALGAIGVRAKAAVPDLIKLLQAPSTDEDTRESAAYALGAIGSEAKEVVPDLIKLLAPETVKETRRGAVRALGAMGSEAQAAVPALIRLLTPETDEETRAKAANALSAMGSEAKMAVPALIRLLTPETHEDTREGAVRALGRIGAEAKAAVPDLIKLLDPELNEGISEKAVYALGGIGAEAKAAVPDLIKLLRYPSKTIRQSAVRALGEIGAKAKAAVPDLITLLRSGVEDYTGENLIRVSAGNALDKIGSEAKEVVPDLIKLLAPETDEDTKEGAVRALGEIGSEARAAVPDLIKLLLAPSTNENTRSMTADAIEAIQLPPGENAEELIKYFSIHIFFHHSIRAILLQNPQLTQTTSALLLRQTELGMERYDSSDLDMRKADSVIWPLFFHKLKYGDAAKNSYYASWYLFHTAQHPGRYHDLENLMEWVCSKDLPQGSPPPTLRSIAKEQLYCLQQQELLRKVFPAECESLRRSLEDFGDRLWMPIWQWLRWIVLGCSVFAVWVASLGLLWWFAPVSLLAFAGMLPWRGPMVSTLAQSNRVLDAWMLARRDKARETLANSRVFGGQRPYVERPIRWLAGDSSIVDLPDSGAISAKLQALAEKGSACMQVTGPGGAGKTSLLRKLVSRWMDEIPKNERGKQHHLLPLMMREGQVDNIRAALQENLELLTGEKNVPAFLLSALLAKGRVVPVFDAITEFSPDHLKKLIAYLEETRQRPAFILTTGRQEVSLDRAFIKTETVLIGRDEILPFALDYLKQAQAQSTFAQQQEIGNRLVMMLKRSKQSEVTPLFVKLCCDQEINRERKQSASKPPASFSQMITEYAAWSLGRDSGERKSARSNDLPLIRLLARVAMHQNLVPSSLMRAKAIPVLQQKAGLSQAEAQSFLEKLDIAGILKGSESLRFSHDTITEFLAAQGWAYDCGDDESKWAECWQNLTTASEARPEVGEGFFQALAAVTSDSAEEGVEIPKWAVAWVEWMSREKRVLLAGEEQEWVTPERAGVVDWLRHSRPWLVLTFVEPRGNPLWSELAAQHGVLIADGTNIADEAIAALLDGPLPRLVWLGIKPDGMAGHILDFATPCWENTLAGQFALPHPPRQFLPLSTAYPRNIVWYIEARISSTLPGGAPPLADSMGSAVAVRLRRKEDRSGNGRNYLLTCQHVVRKDEGGQKGVGQVYGEMLCWAPSSGYTKPADIPKRHSGICPGAFAARIAHEVRPVVEGTLPVSERLPANDWLILEVADAAFQTRQYAMGFATVQQGETLDLIGYPGGARYWPTGKLVENLSSRDFTQERTPSAGTLNLNGAASTAPGMSGGGVFNNAGRLVGIHRAQSAEELIFGGVEADHIRRELSARGWEVISEP